MTRLLPTCLAAVAVGYLWHAYTIPLDSWSQAEAINARTLPLIYGAVLLVISLALLARPPSADPTAVGVAPARWRDLAFHAAAIIGFGMLIPWAGLWISSAVLLVASLFIAGERRPPVLLLAPVGTAALAWLLIAVVLNVYIDPGRWFS